jgi:hypothetical protein
MMLSEREFCDRRLVGIIFLSLLVIIINEIRVENGGAFWAKVSSFEH